MAEENEEPTVEEEEEESEGGSGGGKLVLLIGLINTLGLLGLAAYIMTGGGGGAAPPPPPDQLSEQATSKDAPAGLPEAKGAPGPKVELGELVVNLREPTGDRYLKTKIELEIDSEETRGEVEGRLSAIKYQLNLLLSGQRVNDVQGPEAIETLRKSMIRRANAVLGKGRIINVWPAEWIVQ